MAQIKAQITQELVDYLARHSRQDDVLARVERETATMPSSMMATTPDEAALLTMLARLVGARRALEIGTFTGYGAISIARGLAEGGSLTCLEVSEEYAGIARRHVADAGLSDRVDIAVGPAHDALRAMPEEPTFDYVFIDADKAGYPTYYDLVVPRLVPGGLLLLDNVLLRGAVVDPQDDRTRTMASLNDRVTADERVDSVMVFVADGLTLVRKR
jgi:predicted O-methyltransferase YrrM